MNGNKRLNNDETQASLSLAHSRPCAGVPRPPGNVERHHKNNTEHDKSKDKKGKFQKVKNKRIDR